jgi:hypothetical protein
MERDLSRRMADVLVPMAAAVERQQSLIERSLVVLADAQRRLQDRRSPRPSRTLQPADRRSVLWSRLDQAQPSER